MLLSYRTNMLYTVLWVAAKVPKYYVQCYKKLHPDIIVYSTIVPYILLVKALHKGPRL